MHYEVLHRSKVIVNPKFAVLFNWMLEEYSLALFICMSVEDSAKFCMFKYVRNPVLGGGDHF